MSINDTSSGIKEAYQTDSIYAVIFTGKTFHTVVALEQKSHRITV